MWCVLVLGRPLPHSCTVHAHIHIYTSTLTTHQINNHNRDPKHPDSFVVGSLEQPRRIEVYSAQAGFQIANVRSEYMNSVQSVCVFHPTRNVLVGANSSGRTHVFRGP